MTNEGIKVLDGTGYERDGVGFAGTKGFVGGFGRGVLTSFGEPEIKTFVKASVDEAMKLERAMVTVANLEASSRAPLCSHRDYCGWRSSEIFPYLGTSRLLKLLIDMALT
jgi:hypothetical protein